jgi:hypothetical protein
VIIDIQTELLQEALKYGTKLSADAIAARATRYVDEIGAWFGKGKNQEIARRAVERVLAEAASYPPTKALSVALHSGPAESGFDGSGISEEDRASIVFRITNRADFGIQLAKLRGTIDVIDNELCVSYEVDSPSQLEINARDELRLPCTAMLSRKHDLPSFSYGAVRAAGRLNCLVMGPWKDEPHNEQSFQLGSVWLRVAPELLAAHNPELNEADATNLLNHWMKQEMNAARGGFTAQCALYSPIRFLDIDKELELPDGTSARLLPDLLVSAGWIVTRRGAQTLQVEPSETLRRELAQATSVGSRDWSA